MEKLFGLRRLIVASWAMINLMVLAFMAMYAKPESLGVINGCVYGVVGIATLFFGQRALEKKDNPISIIKNEQETSGIK